MSLQLETIDTPRGQLDVIPWSEPNPFAVYAVRRATRAVAAGRTPDFDDLPLDSIAMPEAVEG